MILIADSGSTKTDWRLIDTEKNIRQASTQGLNPYFIPKESIVTELDKVLKPQLGDGMKELRIFFYGSGCGAEEKKMLMADALRTVFPDADVDVQSDLLGAARGLCGREKGVAAILGTGSNACYYDGTQITEYAASLGYILGDEGSGAHIGRQLLSLLLHKKLSEKMENDFQARYNMGRDKLLDQIYRKPFPNRFMASFSKFVYQHINDSGMAELVADCFREFFDKQVAALSKGTFNCCGSVGFYFSNILKRVAEEKQIPVGKIVESPAAGLTLYHLGEI